MAEAKKRRRRAIASAASGALVAGGVMVALGPAAPWIVDNGADGVRVWRLGYIEFEGVSGGWLGALRAERITIADEEGVWIEARDVALDWRPQEIPFGGVRIERVRAASVAILRQPTLLEARPPGRADLDVRIDDLHVDALSLTQDVVGVEARFSADFGLDLRNRTLHRFEAALQRLDSEDDRLIAAYRPGADYLLNVDIESAPGGVIARALGVGEQGLRATAQGEGDAIAGTAQYAALAGEAELFSGASRWDAARWSLAAQARLDILPHLASLAQRIGPSVVFNAAGVHAGAFDAHVETPFLAVDMEGALNEELALEGPAHFVATTARVSDIARESPFELGAARLEGELRRARGTTAIQATLDAPQIDALGRRVRMRGPVSASLTRKRFHLAGQLAAATDSPALFANAQLRTELAYDRSRGRFTLDTAEITGDAVTFNGQGWVTGGDGEFAGEWRVRRLSALFGDLTGQAGGRWRAFSERADGSRVWTTAVDGAGAGVGGAPDIVPQFLGQAPQLDARFRYENRGITVSHARVQGERLRAGATGRIVRGQADLVLEASARGPLSLGDARIAGAVDATGRLSGSIARPTLSAHAVMSSFTAGGVVVERPAVDFTLAPSERAYAGRAQAQGAASGQPLTASANVAVSGGALMLSDLDGQWGGLAAQGSAAITSRGIGAELDVNGAIDGLMPGARGRLVGEVSLTPETVTLDAQIMDARAGELRVRAATLHAEGPHDAIAGRFELRGRLRRASLAFTGTGLLDLSGDAALTIEGRGALAEADIFTRAPMRAQWNRNALDASLNVAMGDGVVRAQWRERGRAVSGSAQIDDAPLAPLAAIWGERASGRIDGNVALANDGRGLSGVANLTLMGARFAGRQRGTLDLHIVGDLDPARLRAVVDATSTEGLTAHFEADAPVTTSADPIRIALARERRGRATWSVHGPAQSLWAAARLQDQSLEGRLDGEGELSFGAGYLSGAGHIEIVDGAFEDKLTGVRLVDLNARVGIDDRGVRIETFTAAGPRGGRLTAAGGSDTQREGSITVTIDDMRVADRADAHARASGELTLAWEGLHSELSGDLEIIEASIDIASNPEADIPTLHVIEVNRPGEFDDDEEDDAPRRNGAAALNVNIAAPGRVFTRGRGVDAEWSLDLRLQGTARNPQVFGVARAVRGTLALSGQPFEIDDARIMFTGDPLDARIDMSATRDTADLTARIRLTGTARAPEIAFSSDPPLPEDEILPQVLFGRSVEDLSALEAAQLAASLAALSGRASLDLVDAARAAAGLDRFNVRQDGAGGFLVAGGVYLTRDVYVELARTGLGEAQTRVEWTVRPRLVLITSFLGNGDQSVSLRWRRETD
jgi:translocation and assembly module TamB